MMRMHQSDAPCPDCARVEAAEAQAPDEDENDMGGNFSRDVFMLTAVVYGAPALAAVIALVVFFWNRS